MEAGDILFYSGDDWQSRIIQQATHGPFSHVEIAVSALTSIGALGKGVTQHPAPTPDACATTGDQLTYTGLQAGLDWLHVQVGKSYGWLDDAVDAVGVLLPRFMARTPFLVAPSAYNCSDLATRFLIHAGYLGLPANIVDYPTRVSPNDLARALHVIK